MSGSLIKQVTVHLENKPGMLSTISEILGEEHVNIRGMSVTETADFSVVRFIADFPEPLGPTTANRFFLVRSPKSPNGMK